MPSNDELLEISQTLDPSLLEMDFGDVGALDLEFDPTTLAPELLADPSGIDPGMLQDDFLDGTSPLPEQWLLPPTDPSSVADFGVADHSQMLLSSMSDLDLAQMVEQGQNIPSGADPTAFEEQAQVELGKRIDKLYRTTPVPVKDTYSLEKQRMFNSFNKTLLEDGDLPNRFEQGANYRVDQLLVNPYNSTIEWLAELFTGEEKDLNLMGVKWRRHYQDWLDERDVIQKELGASVEAGDVFEEFGKLALDSMAIAGSYGAVMATVKGAAMLPAALRGMYVGAAYTGVETFGQGFEEEGIDWADQSRLLRNNMTLFSLMDGGLNKLGGIIQAVTKGKVTKAGLFTETGRQELQDELGAALGIRFGASTKELENSVANFVAETSTGVTGPATRRLLSRSKKRPLGTREGHAPREDAGVGFLGEQNVRATQKEVVPEGLANIVSTEQIQPFGKQAVLLEGAPKGFLKNTAPTPAANAPVTKIPKGVKTEIDTHAPGPELHMETVKTPRQAAFWALRDYMENSWDQIGVKASQHDLDVAGALSQFKGVGFERFFTENLRGAHGALELLHSTGKGDLVQPAKELLEEAFKAIEAGGKSKLTNPQNWGNTWKLFNERQAQVAAEESTGPLKNIVKGEAPVGHAPTTSLTVGDDAKTFHTAISSLTESRLGRLEAAGAEMGEPIDAALTGITSALNRQLQPSLTIQDIISNVSVRNDWEFSMGLVWDSVRKMHIPGDLADILTGGLRHVARRTGDGKKLLQIVNDQQVYAVGKYSETWKDVLQAIDDQSPLGTFIRPRGKAKRGTKDQWQALREATQGELGPGDPGYDLFTKNVTEVIKTKLDEVAKLMREAEYEEITGLPIIENYWPVGYTRKAQRAFKIAGMERDFTSKEKLLGLEKLWNIQKKYIESLYPGKEASAREIKRFLQDSGGGKDKLKKFSHFDYQRKLPNPPAELRLPASVELKEYFLGAYSQLGWAHPKAANIGWDKSPSRINELLLGIANDPKGGDLHAYHMDKLFRQISGADTGQKWWNAIDNNFLMRGASKTVLSLTLGRAFLFNPSQSFFTTAADWGLDSAAVGLLKSIGQVGFKNRALIRRLAKDHPWLRSKELDDIFNSGALLRDSLIDHLAYDDIVGHGNKAVELALKFQLHWPTERFNHFIEANAAKYALRKYSTFLRMDDKKFRKSRSLIGVEKSQIVEELRRIGFSDRDIVALGKGPPTKAQEARMMSMGVSLHHFARPNALNQPIWRNEFKSAGVLTTYANGMLRQSFHLAKKMSPKIVKNKKGEYEFIGPDLNAWASVGLGSTAVYLGQSYWMHILGRSLQDETMMRQMTEALFGWEAGGMLQRVVEGQEKGYDGPLFIPVTFVAEAGRALFGVREYDGLTVGQKIEKWTKNNFVTGKLVMRSNLMSTELQHLTSRTRDIISSQLFKTDGKRYQEPESVFGETRSGLHLNDARKDFDQSEPPKLQRIEGQEKAHRGMNSIVSAIIAKMEDSPNHPTLGSALQSVANSTNAHNLIDLIPKQYADKNGVLYTGKEVMKLLKDRVNPEQWETLQNYEKFRLVRESVYGEAVRLINQAVDLSEVLDKGQTKTDNIRDEIFKVFETALGQERVKQGIVEAEARLEKRWGEGYKNYPSELKLPKDDEFEVFPRSE